MPAPRTCARRAFSLVELAMVCAIMGVVAAIAAPRMSSAAESSRAVSVKASAAQLQRAVDFYAAEHADRSPATEPDGSPSVAGLAIAQRLMRRTDDLGTVKPTGIFGPYMQLWPVNPYNGLAKMRIDGAPAGANTAGWRFDSATMKVEADHAATGHIGVVTSGTIKPGGAAAAEAMNN
jgi:prepilin-type N-terminal cleavage/methylation domain-containing protein